MVCVRDSTSLYLLSFALISYGPNNIELLKPRVLRLSGLNYKTFCDNQQRFNSFFFLMFIYFWERDRVWVGEGRERETQNPKQVPGSALSAQSPDMGLELTNLEIMTWARVGCSTNWATQAPLSMHIFMCMCLDSTWKQPLKSLRENDYESHEG